MNPKVSRFLKSHSLRFWLMLGGLVLALLGFEEVVDDVFFDPKEGDHEAQIFDSTIRDYVNGIRNVTLNQVMTDLTALGSVSVIATLFVIFLSIMMTYRDFNGISFLFTVASGAGVWPVLLKLYFVRGRPEQGDWLVNVSDHSFPSGHSFGAAATYVGLAYYASRYARTWSQEVFFYFLGGLLAVLVGLSRVYLGVHYPTDVLAGLSGGIAWGLMVSLYYESRRNRLKRR